MRRALALAAVAAMAAGVPAAASARPGTAHARHAAQRHRAHVSRPVHRWLPAAWTATGWTAGPVTAAPGAPGPSTSTPTPVPTAVPAAPAPTATPAPAGPSVPGLPAADPRSVSVRSTEWAFTLSQPTVTAGRVRLQFDNSRAEDPHDLVVEGAGDVVFHLGQQPAGAVTSASVDLAAGTYRLVCPLTGHEAKGMAATLRVTG